MRPPVFDAKVTPEDIAYCYRLLIGREPDKDDWKVYTTAINAGWSLEILVRSFLSSMEFKNYRLAIILGETDPRKEIGSQGKATMEDLRYCYRLFLRRDPDKKGKKVHGSLIKKGCSLTFLVRSFLVSPEFRGKEFAQALSPPKLELVRMKAGFDLYVYSNDTVIGQEIRRTQEFEPHITCQLKSELFPGAVFLDIGANIGYYTVLAARAVGPRGKVYSFEPFQPNIPLIHYNAQVNGLDNVFLYPFALAEKRGTFTAYSVDTNAGLLEFTGDWKNSPYKDIVFSATLDELLAGVEKVDIMKIDVEGFEYRALLGGVNILGKHRPVIFSEILPESLVMASGKRAEEYLQHIIDHHYSLAIITKEGRKIECDTNVEKIMSFYHEGQSDHIDIVAHPSLINTLSISKTVS